MSNPEQSDDPPSDVRSQATGKVDSAKRVDELFRSFVDGVTDYAIFMLDLEGNVLSWNAGAQRIKGYAPEEIIGHHFSRFYPPELAAERRWEKALRSATDDGHFEEDDWRLRKDGSKFWANVVITAVHDAEGRVVSFGKVTRDLTERRIAEEKLRRSEERLRLLIASVTDYAIFHLDSTGHVASWNPGAERLKGYRADEIIGRHFSVFYPREDVDAGKCEMELVGAERVGRFEDEGWRVRKDGTTFWANVVITPIRDADGHLTGFAKVTRDLSERRRHEQEQIAHARAEEARRAAEASEESTRVLAQSLREARDKAEEATRLKDEFLATVSHELRTPLHVMLGWARLLQAGSLDAIKSSHAVDTIVRNAVAQSQIIEDLLDVSRIIGGQLRLEVDLVDVETVVRAAIDVVGPAAEAKGIAITTDIDPDASIIKGDPTRLQQVFWNLLANAVKFTPRGGRIQIVLRREDSLVRVDVVDTGRGIAPGFLDRVFERFSQEDSSNTRRAGGLGLGLAIVKHLIELHGGTVEVQSAGPGTGATFTVRIPVVAITTRSSKDSGSGTDELAFAADLRGLSVLVLDDELDARELIQSVLERAGARVQLAETVADALALVRFAPPDVIVSDIGMPNEDGYSFIRQLRALPLAEGGRVPAVALTAYARAEDRRKALVAGFQNHTAKPIDPQEFVIVLANLTGRYS